MLDLGNIGLGELSFKVHLVPSEAEERPVQHGATEEGVLPRLWTRELDLRPAPRATDFEGEEEPISIAAHDEHQVRVHDGAVAPARRWRRATCVGLLPAKLCRRAAYIRQLPRVVQAALLARATARAAPHDDAARRRVQCGAVAAPCWERRIC